MGHRSVGEAGWFAPIGELTLIEDGARVVCHLCGAGFAFLPGHLPAHGWTAAGYREAFGLNRSTPLSSPAVRERRRELGLARYAADPRLREGLAQGQALARSGELLALSHAVQQPGNARAQRRSQAAAATALTRRRTAEDAPGASTPGLSSWASPAIWTGTCASATWANTGRSW